MLGITKYILRSKIKREEAQRQKKFLPWEKIEKIALILEKQDALNKSSIDKFIEESKKYIEVFYIDLRSKQPSFSDWHCFSKKDKSIWNLPNKTMESELRSKKFDVVINTCNDSNLFAFAVSASLPAYLKCSQTNGYNLSDLVIAKPEPFTLKNYLEETVRYLRMIRI